MIYVGFKQIHCLQGREERVKEGGIETGRESERVLREKRVRETERGERKSVAKEREYLYIRVGVFACEKRNKNIKEGKQENNCF